MGAAVGKLALRLIVFALGITLYAVGPVEIAQAQTAPVTRQCAPTLGVGDAIAPIIDPATGAASCPVGYLLVETGAPGVIGTPPRPNSRG